MGHMGLSPSWKTISWWGVTTEHLRVLCLTFQKRIIKSHRINKHLLSQWEEEVKYRNRSSLCGHAKLESSASQISKSLRYCLEIITDFDCF